MNNILDIEYSQEEYEEQVPRLLVKKTVDFVLSKFATNPYELSITFVSDDEIRQLNKQWRNIDLPTDVLSFVQADNIDEVDFWPDSEEEEILGDLIISIGSIQRNCEDFNVPFKEEVLRVIIHGVLHLLGYDHETNDKNEAMLILQEEILSETREI